MPGISKDGAWVIVADFDPTTGRDDKCSVSGLRKRKDDIGVFRPIRTLIEYEGYFDISQYAIEQAARMLDWKSPEEVQALKDRIAALEAEIETARSEAFKKAADAVKMAGVRASKNTVDL